MNNKNNKNNSQIIIENNENLSQCAKCGGRCCKSMPCEIFPQDVFGDKEPSFELLKEWIEKHPLYCIDWWDGDVRGLDWCDDDYLDRCYYIHPKTKGEKDRGLFIASWGGECIFLTDTGCSLSWEDRPLGGKALTPGPLVEKMEFLNGKPIIMPTRYACTSSYSKKEACIAWLPYHEWFEKLY